MAAYRRVYDSRYLQIDCQEPGSAPEPYVWQSSMGYFPFFSNYSPKMHRFELAACDRQTDRQTDGRIVALLNAHPQWAAA